MRIADRVDHGQIFVGNVAALARQILLDATELLALISMPKLYQLC
jgi:hypothetical protein